MVGKVKKGKKKNLRFDQMGLIAVLAFLFLLYPGENRYSYAKSGKFSKKIINNPLSEFSPSDYPRRLRLYSVPEISARAVYIFDPKSGVVLFAKNSNLKLSPASTTKLLTSQVALEHYKLSDILEVKKLVTKGRSMGLVYKERISAENLLYGVLVHSANDAAFVLADNYPGGIDSFVDKMNQKAQALGLFNSHFTNPAGFDNAKQYITAKDLAILSNYILSNPILAHIVGTKAITVSDEAFQYFHYLDNVNELLGEVPGVAGVKTGFTKEARENLATLIKRGKREVIVVVLGSEDRFADTRSLIDWIFREFRWETIAPIQD